MDNLEEKIVAAPEDAPEELTAEAEISSDTDTKDTIDTADTASDPAEVIGEEPAEEAKDETPAKKKKRRSYIQIPVLISLGIVVAALIGYFVYQAFFLHLPQGIIWTEDRDGITYYYEFTDDNMFKIVYASYEEAVSYQEVTEGGEDVIRLHYPDGTVDLTCYMSGARIRKDQKITLTTDKGNDVIDAVQTDCITPALELPAEVHTDSKLIGSWEFVPYNGLIYRMTFTEDGSMRFEIITEYDDYRYVQANNVTYTVSDGVVSYTFASLTEDEETGKQKVNYDVISSEYLVEGEHMIFKNFSDMVFTRVKTDATPDEA